MCYGDIAMSAGDCNFARVVAIGVSDERDIENCTDGAGNADTGQ
jgi:hypothetical protein